MRRRHFLAYSSLFAAGCSAPTSLDGVGTVSKTRPEKLRLAITDVKGLEPLKGDYGPFRDALEKVLALPIEFFPVEDYLTASPALLSGNVDLVLSRPSEYLIMRARAEAIPLVAVTRPDYYSLIAVKADSDLRSIADLKDKTIAMRTEGSTAGHIGATKLLLDEGLEAKDFRIKMLKGKELEALLSGEVDAWAVSNSRYAQFVEAAAAHDRVRVVSKGEGLPDDVFVVRSTLDSGFIQDIRKRMVQAQTALLAAMASTPANEKYRQSTFTRTEDSQYEALREVYRAIGKESVIQ